MTEVCLAAATYALSTRTGIPELVRAPVSGAPLDAEAPRALDVPPPGPGSTST
jgi:hypothetical protein